eukprot:scaffold7381_cov310-Pinguiococcus_pyrenoidosus.AAC.58
MARESQPFRLGSSAEEGGAPLGTLSPHPAPTANFGGIGGFFDSETPPDPGNQLGKETLGTRAC